jgi:hypothetical protein
METKSGGQTENTPLSALLLKGYNKTHVNNAHKIIL